MGRRVKPIGHLMICLKSLWALFGMLPGCGKESPTKRGENTQPVACFSADPHSGDTQTLFEVDAFCSDDAEDDADSPQVRWHWKNDGVWDADWATTKTARHRYETLGSKTICLEVKDTGALTDTTTRIVTVTGPPNTPPLASFSVAPEFRTTETVFEFDASGCSDAEDDVDSLQVRWDWENDGVWDTDWSTTKVASHRFTTRGKKTIAIEVKNTGELTGTTSQQVTVSIAKPQLILIPSGAFQMGDGLQCQGIHQVTLTHNFYLSKYEVTTHSIETLCSGLTTTVL